MGKGRQAQTARSISGIRSSDCRAGVSSEAIETAQQKAEEAAKKGPTRGAGAGARESAALRASAAEAPAPSRRARSVGAFERPSGCGGQGAAGCASGPCYGAVLGATVRLRCLLRASRGHGADLQEPGDGLPGHGDDEESVPGGGSRRVHAMCLQHLAAIAEERTSSEGWPPHPCLRVSTRRQHESEWRRDWRSECRKVVVWPSASSLEVIWSDGVLGVVAVRPSQRIQRC